MMTIVPLALVGLALSTVMGCNAGDMAMSTTGGGGTSTAGDECAKLPKPTVVGTGGCVMDLASDGTNAYWIDNGGVGSDLRRIDPGIGTMLFPVATSDDGTMYRVVARGGRVYVLEDHVVPAGYIQGLDVRSVKVDGSGATTLMAGLGLPLDVEIAANDTAVFAASGSSGDLYAATPAGDPPVLLAMGLDLESPSANDAFIYGIGFGEGPGGKVFRVPVGGGPPEPLSVDHVALARIDGAFLDVVVYVSTDTRKLQRVPLDGGPTITVAEGTIFDFALDASHAYWIGEGAGVYMAPIDGGPAQQIACMPPVQPGPSPDVSPPMRIAALGTNVYFTSGDCTGDADDGPELSGGSVFSVPIPAP